MERIEMEAFIMQKRKAALALVLSAGMALTAMSPTALALNPHMPAATYQTESTTTQEYQDPRFSYISRISSSLSFGVLGRTNCTGSFTTYDEYDSRMTVTLQQSKDGAWTDLKEWSEEYTTSGFKAMEKHYYVPSGYRYRVVTTVEILDSDGTVLEMVYCDSPIKEY